VTWLPAFLARRLIMVTQHPLRSCSKWVVITTRADGASSRNTYWIPAEITDPYIFDKHKVRLGQVIQVQHTGFTFFPASHKTMSNYPSSALWQLWKRLSVRMSRLKWTLHHFLRSQNVLSHALSKFIPFMVSQEVLEYHQRLELRPQGYTGWRSRFRWSGS